MDTTSSLEDVDWNQMNNANASSSPTTQRPLWRTWIETHSSAVINPRSNDTTSSLEDVDWNITSFAILVRHVYDTTSSLEDVDWNIRDDGKRVGVFGTQRPLWRTWIETLTYSFLATPMPDTTSSLEDVDWNCSLMRAMITLPWTQRPLWRTWIETECQRWEGHHYGSTQRPLWRTWIETSAVMIVFELCLDTTSSLEDVDWNIRSLADCVRLYETQRPLWRTWIETNACASKEASSNRHNVLFGGRGLKLSCHLYTYPEIIETQRPLWRTWIETTDKVSCWLIIADDTTSSLEDVDWNRVISIWRCAKRRHNVLFGGRGLKRDIIRWSGLNAHDTTSSLEDVDWNFVWPFISCIPGRTQRPLWRTWIETTNSAGNPTKYIRHNVLFGGRGLKHEQLYCSQAIHQDTTSSLEDVDWNFRRWRVEKTKQADTTSSLEDVDWN